MHIPQGVEPGLAHATNAYTCKLLYGFQGYLTFCYVTMILFYAARTDRLVIMRHASKSISLAETYPATQVSKENILDSRWDVSSILIKTQSPVAADVLQVQTLCTICTTPASDELAITERSSSK